MRTRTIAALLTVAALMACSKAEPPHRPPPRAEVLKDVPTPGYSNLQDTTGSEDAERRTFRVQLRLDSVRAFYRDTLVSLGWSVMGEQGDSLLFNMYARRGPATLWVRMERTPLPDNVRIVSGGLTTFTLIASSDSTATVAPVVPDSSRP